MKNIRLFESFQKDGDVKYPDSEWWLNYLHMEEICYLILYSEYKEPIIFVERAEWPSIWQLEDDGDRDASSSFEILLTTPVRGENADVTVDGSFSGYFTPYIPGTYMDPPEGGDPMVSNYEIEYIQYLDNFESEEREIFIDGSDNVNSQSDIITIDMIRNLCDHIVEENIGSENETVWDIPEGRKEPILPQSLIDKIERIRKEHRREIFILNR